MAAEAQDFDDLFEGIEDSKLEVATQPSQDPQDDTLVVITFGGGDFSIPMSQDLR